MDDRGARKARVVVLAGFLGAGKTTLLRRILSWEADLSGTVVVVNEFGEVGIDGALLQDAGSDVIELASGCVCCTLKADLIQTLQSVWERFHPERVLIEATGIADPEGIVDAFRHPEVSRYMEIDRVVTVLDAEYWEAREVFGPLFYRQLEAADIILLNKIDLVESAQVSRFLREIHDAFPGSRVVPTVHCAVDPETLWSDLRAPERGTAPETFIPVVGREEDHHHHDHQHAHGACAEEERDSTAGYVAFSFESDRPLKEDCFREFVEALPWEVFRMKGIVRFSDRTLLVNYVGGKGDWREWDGAGRTRLAFVGWEVDGDEVVQKLKSCTQEDSVLA